MSEEALGDLTAARVRDAAEAIERLALLTGLTREDVRAQLGAASGQTLACKVFAQDWRS